MKEEYSWDESKTVAANARAALPVLAGRFFAAGRKAVKPSTPAADLHAFRLLAKRFRYTLELFRPVYGATLETLIESLRRVQGYLGDINDCEVSRRLVLEEAGSRRSPQVRAVLRVIDTRQAEKLEALQQYWDENFRPRETSRKWVNYLAVYPGRVRRAAGKTRGSASARGAVVRG